MPNDDDPPEPGEAAAKLPSFATVPPPAGAIDEHSAATTVAELPDSFLEELKAATKQEAASRAAGRDLQTTQRNHSFELELREQLTAQLVDRRAEPGAPAPASGPAPLVVEPASSPVVAVAPPPAPSSEPPSSAPPRAPVPAADRVSVVPMALLALLAIAAMAWTYLTTLR